jgi:hypothetical protein
MPATQLCRGRTAGRQLDTRRRRELCPLPGLRSAADGLAPNHQLQGYLHERKRPVAFTRSRPYHKDDNAHVEQKNWMWPRQLLGYGRLESAAAVVPLCTLYQEAWGAADELLSAGTEAGTQVAGAQRNHRGP